MYADQTRSSYSTSPSMRPLTARSLAGATCPPSDLRLTPRLLALASNCLFGNISTGSERSPRTDAPRIFPACAPVKGLTTSRGRVGAGVSGLAFGAATVAPAAPASGIRPLFISPATIRLERRVRLEDVVRNFSTRCPLAFRTSVSPSHRPSTRRTRVRTSVTAPSFAACFA